MSADKTTLDELRIDRSFSKQRRSRAWAIILAIVALAFAGGAVAWFNLTRPAAVITTTVREGASGQQKTLLNASGYVTARREATVSSKVTGKVIEVLIEEGMSVEVGQVLARIDASNVQASLRLAEAQHTAAQSTANEIKVRLNEAERELRRQSQL